MSMRQLGIILQARMDSSRLPGKVLRDIGGKPILGHIFFRLKSIKSELTVILATSIDKDDDVIVNFCETNKINIFRGSNKNVLERYYLCAKKFGLKNIVRLTADNPFVDIEELDNLILLHGRSGADFTNSYSSLPIGVGAEIFTFEALEKSHKNGRLAHHLEHVDEYMLENPQIFKTSILSVPSDKNKPKIRLTIDTAEDLKMAEYIVKNAKEEFITTQEAIRLCEIYLNPK